MKIHETEDDGDILAFLTGQVRFYLTIRLVSPLACCSEIHFCFIYSYFPHQEEVEKVVSFLQDQARSLSRYGMKKHLRILPMYSGLPYADQLKVFERAPSSVRKVNLFLFIYIIPAPFEIGIFVSSFTRYKHKVA